MKKKTSIFKQCFFGILIILMSGMLNVLSSVADTVKAGDDSESKVVKSQQKTAENVTAKEESGVQNQTDSSQSTSSQTSDLPSSTKPEQKSDTSEKALMSTTKNAVQTSLSDLTKTPTSLSSEENTNTDPSTLGKISDLFPDAIFAKYIASVLNLSVNDEVTQSQLDTIVDVSIQELGISSIEGIQYLHNASDLRLYNNNISDLTPLSKMTVKSFWHIWLTGNPIVDISPLTNMTGIYVRDLYLHRVPLGNDQLPNLAKIFNSWKISRYTFGSNHIDDFSKLKNTIIDWGKGYNNISGGNQTIDLGTQVVSPNKTFTVHNPSTYFDGTTLPVDITTVTNGGVVNPDQSVTWASLYTDKPDSLSFRVKNGKVDVTYTVHLKYVIPASNVIVKYVDEDGNEIHPSQSISGNLGDAYDATTDQYKLAINNYTLDESKSPNNSKGVLTDQEQTVTYVYTKDPVAGGNVTAKYVDTSGNAISDNVVKTGNIGDTYSTEQKTIPGYTFKEVQGSASGQFTDQEQTVTYVYTKDPVAGGSVTAKFVDTSGNAISDDVVKTGNIGDTYSTEQKTIPGYTFKEVQGSASGQFTDQEQTVTYVYTKDPVAGGSVTAKYVDTSGNAISDDVVKTGNIGDTYSTEQKTIPGYTFKEVQGSASGQFTDQEQTVTYVYTKDPATTASTSTTTVEPTTTVSTSTTTVEPTTTVAATTTTVEPTTTAAATTTTVEPTTTVAATTTTVEPTTTVAATTTTVEPTTTASTSTTTVEPTTTVSTSTTTVEPTTTVAATTTTVEPTTTAAATTTTVEPTTTVAATTTTVEPTTTAAATTTTASTTTVAPTTSVTTTAATTVDVPGTTTGVTPPPAGGKKGRTLPKTGEESGLTTSLVGFALMSVASVAAVLYRKSKKA